MKRQWNILITGQITDYRLYIAPWFAILRYFTLSNARRYTRQGQGAGATTPSFLPPALNACYTQASAQWVNHNCTWISWWMRRQTRVVLHILSLSSKDKSWWYHCMKISPRSNENAGYTFSINWVASVLYTWEDLSVSSSVHFSFVKTSSLFFDTTPAQDEKTRQNYSIFNPLSGNALWMHPTSIF